MPRKILAASEIFVDGYESPSMDRSTATSDSASAYFAEDRSRIEATPSADMTMSTIPSELPSFALEGQSFAIPGTPSRRRHATVVTRLPQPGGKGSLTIDTTRRRSIYLWAYLS